MPIVLIPISGGDRILLERMTAPSAPLWMRIAGCLAAEGRRVVLPKNGHPVWDDCARCQSTAPATVHAFHKDRRGLDARCILSCDRCGGLVEDRVLSHLEARPENPLAGIARSF